MRFIPRSLLAACAVIAFVAAPAHAAARPTSFALPPGFSAEAMTDHNGALYVGSQADGSVLRVDVRTGEQTVLVPGHSGRHANGLRFAGKRLIVAGGTTGKIYVYNALTGRDVATHDVHGGFVNGVGILGKTAYATDTIKHVVYALPTSGVGAVRTITLTGDWTPDAFDLDGIIPAGRELLTGQYGTGKLFTVDAATGVSHAVQGVSVPTNDGLFLKGRTLFVAENSGKVQEVALNADMTAGRVVKTLPKHRLRDPTDVAVIGGRLYVLNPHNPQRRAPPTARDQILDLGKA
ncbi:MAG TPA: hypothetical protein VGM91_01265 [Conexibacter sp.]|jgi:hypothetical protein